MRRGGIGGAAAEIERVDIADLVAVRIDVRVTAQDPVQLYQSPEHGGVHVGIGAHLQQVVERCAPAHTVVVGVATGGTVVLLIVDRQLCHGVSASHDTGIKSGKGEARLFPIGIYHFALHGRCMCSIRDGGKVGLQIWRLLALNSKTKEFHESKSKIYLVVIVYGSTFAVQN